MKSQIQIALAEDNPINRNTFLQKIERISHCKVVFIARDGSDCLNHLKDLAPDQLPHIIFMDIEMPELNGIQTISLGKQLYPQVHFIVLTVFDDDEKIFEAIKAGASGYLLKHESATVFEEAIQNVLESGGAPMSPGIARKALQLLSKSSLPEKRAGAAIPADISDREKEILEQLVGGKDARKIALTLNLSVLTVRKHIANIYAKLHINSKAQAINLAHKEGWFR